MHTGSPYLPHPHVIRSAWLLFLLVWMIGATRTKRTRTRQSDLMRAVQIALGMMVWLLIAVQHYPVLFLERRLFPESASTLVAGILLLYGGIAFAIAARVSLGSNWSANVTIKEEHELVCTGLYSLVRNPIYTGLFVALLGTALLIGAVHAFLAFALSIPLFMWKTKSEEQFMEQVFGAQYPAYRQRVRGFIPFVW